VSDCSAKLGFDIVTNYRDAGVLKTLRPRGVAGYKDGHTIYKGHVCSHSAFGIESGGIFGTNGQIIQ
jgi:hypothetical protein